MGSSSSRPRTKNMRDHGGDEAEGAHDEREEDPGLGVRPAGAERDGVDGHAQDHGADVLGGGGLEEVGAAAGAVAHVVAHEVGDDGGVARVVLGDAGSRPCPRGRRPRQRPWCRYRRRAGRRGPRSEAPKPKPTMRKGASAVLTPPCRPPKRAKMPHTPSSERATTRKPETAPPRMAVWTAPTRLVWAAAAVRHVGAHARRTCR